jgi:hypothetical protein
MKSGLFSALFERIDKSYAFHPFLLAFYFVIRLYASYVDLLLAQQIFRSLLVTVGGAMLLMILLKPVVRVFEKRAFFVTIFLFTFFNYTLIGTALASNPVTASLGNYGLLTIYILFLLLTLYVASQSKADFRVLTGLLNIFATVVLAVSLLELANGYWNNAEPGWSPAVERIIAQNMSQPLQVGATRPDIYYIILDGYARADILKEYYNYDNSEFIRFLEARGFYVADESHSNYPQTYLSLASALNLTYLDPLAAAVGEQEDNRRPLEELIQNNSVVQLLKAVGYKTAFIASVFSATRNSDIVDLCVCDLNTLNEFELSLFYLTPVRLFLAQPATFYRQDTLNLLDQLETPPDLDGPMFVLSHIVAPHPPFVFGPNGEEVEVKTFSPLDGTHFSGSDEEYIQGYRDQAAYITKRVEAIVDAILAHSAEPPIIIIQSDHGSGFGLDWESAEKTDMRERFSNFGAYHLPGASETLLYERMTPVNTFRVIFDHYFGTNFKLLEDKSYFALWDQPYHFIEVPAERLEMERRAGATTPPP